MAKFPNLAPPEGAAAAGGKGGKGDPGGVRMEGKLAGIFKRNPAVALGTAGVAAVVVLAMMMKSRNPSSSSDPSAVSAAAQQQFGGISGLYDSTANDVYGSIESQIQSIQQALQDLKDKTTTPATPTTPTPTTPKPVVKTITRPGGPLVKLPHGPVVGSIEYGVYK